VLDTDSDGVVVSGPVYRSRIRTIELDSSCTVQVEAVVLGNRSHVYGRPTDFEGFGHESSVVAEDKKRDAPVVSVRIVGTQ
jgi:hypothetical protein